MLNSWIEKRDDLPDGMMIIDENLRPLLEKIHSLPSDDLPELEAFINYLTTASGALSEGEKKSTGKICDFMAGGMQKVG